MRLSLLVLFFEVFCGAFLQKSNLIKTLNKSVHSADCLFKVIQ